MWVRPVARYEPPSPPASEAVMTRVDGRPRSTSQGVPGAGSCHFDAKSAGASRRAMVHDWEREGGAGAVNRAGYGARTTQPCHYRRVARGCPTSSTAVPRAAGPIPTRETTRAGVLAEPGEGRGPGLLPSG